MSKERVKFLMDKSQAKIEEYHQGPKNKIKFEDHKKANTS
jgi:hypothetical protein